MVGHPAVITESNVLLLPVLAEALVALLVEVALPDWNGPPRTHLRLTVVQVRVARARLVRVSAFALAGSEQVRPPPVLPGRGRGGSGGGKLFVLLVLAVVMVLDEVLLVGNDELALGAGA